MFSGLKLLQPHPPAHPFFLDLKDGIQDGDSSQRPAELNRYVVRKLHLNLPKSVHDKARQDDLNRRGHYRSNGKAPEAISFPLQQLPIVVGKAFFPEDMTIIGRFHHTVEIKKDDLHRICLYSIKHNFWIHFTRRKPNDSMFGKYFLFF